MKEGTANWGKKWLPGDLQTCCQNGSKLGVEASDAKMSKNHSRGDPASGVTFDPTKLLLSPQIGVAWCLFMFTSIFGESTFRS